MTLSTVDTHISVDTHTLPACVLCSVVVVVTPIIQGVDISKPLEGFNGIMSFAALKVLHMIRLIFSFLYIVTCEILP